ncbi:MAG: hypothetical protein GX558_05530 [Clostridiales bacterium]|nr:hypothetical protein [Clostridiales bacterium]
MRAVEALVGRLRGARGIEWIVLLAAVAAAALIWAQGETGGDQAAPTALEARMERVLSAVEGAGRVRVMVNADEAAAAFSMGGAAEAQVKGVVIVAEGAGDLKVALALARAAQALTGAPASAIEVMEMRRAD